MSSGGFRSREGSRLSRPRVRMRWRLLALGLAAGVVLALPAIAAATCTSGRADDSYPYAEGYYHNDSSGFTIVKANVVVKDTYQSQLPSDCATTGCASYAWVMMTNSANSSWAQFGPFYGYNSVFGGYAGPGADVDQCSQGSNHYTVWTRSSSVGSDPLYSVQNGTDPNGNPNNKLFYLNGSLVDWCGYSVDYNFSPTQAQAAGEIIDQQTQLPGGTSGVEQWTNGRLADGSSGFDFFSGGSTKFNPSQYSWMGLNVYSSSTLDTWDKDCP